MSRINEIIGGVNQSINQLKVTAPTLGEVHKSHHRALESAVVSKTGLEVVVDGLKTYLDELGWSNRNGDLASSTAQTALDMLNEVGAQSIPQGKTMTTRVEYVQKSSDNYTTSTKVAAELVTEADVTYLNDLAERIGQTIAWHEAVKDTPAELVKATTAAVMDGVEIRGFL